VLQQTKVLWGASVAAPAFPTHAGKEYDGWDNAAYHGPITSNLTINAKWTNPWVYDPGADPNGGGGGDEGGGGTGGGTGGGGTGEPEIVPEVAETPTPVLPSAASQPAASAPQPAASVPATQDIGAGQAPTGNEASWSLFDLLCTVLAIVAAAVGAVRALLGRRKGEDGEAAQQPAYGQAPAYGAAPGEGGDEISVRTPAVVAAAVAALLALVLFIVTQDLTAKMAVFDWWSIAFAILAVGGLVSSLLVLSRDEADDDAGQGPGQAPAGGYAV